MATFVRGTNPKWYLVNLTGDQFDDTYYLWVLENDIPYSPQEPYQTPTGTQWTNPIQCGANGTFPDNMYFNADLTYRLEFRQNDGVNPPSQSDPLVYLIENYNPNGTNATPSTTDEATVDNQVTNPQFSEVNFNSPYTLSGVTNPDPIEIAPGWFLILEGSGTVTFELVPLDSSIPTPTNAPYALRLTIGAGWTTSPILRQRLTQNGVQWSEQFVASSYTARIEGTAQTVTTRLMASDGTPLLALGSPTIDSLFTEYLGIGEMPAATNLDVPPDAYIDYEVVLPQTVDIYLTSFQLVTSNSLVTSNYQQTTIERQRDHLFHYYENDLKIKRQPSILIGWDFALNPRQFAPTTTGPDVWGPYATGANTSNYVWDQTILFQSSDSGPQVSVGATESLNIEAAAATQFALVQYLDGATVNRLLNNPLSVNISGYTDVSGGISGVVSLWYTDAAALPDMTANDSIVATLNSDGSVATTNFVTDAWTEITPGDLGANEFTLGESATLQYNDIPLSGWDTAGVAAIDDATFFAVVVGFESLAMGDTVSIGSISLCEGNLPTRPAAESVTEVLRNCERYYEKSYSPDEYPGDISTDNEVILSQDAYFDGTNSMVFMPGDFTLEFKTQKRSSAPTVTFYGPTNGTAGDVNSYLFNGQAATRVAAAATLTDYWRFKNLNDKRTTWEADTNAGTPTLTGSTRVQGSGSMGFQYDVDARLGVV